MMPVIQIPEVFIRGINEGQPTMLAYLSPERRVPKDHPLRRIKLMADQELWWLSPVFDKMYSKVGPPFLPREF